VSPLEWVLVGLAGAVGAPARYLVDTAVSRRRGRSLPIGTLVVNVSGALLLGLLAGMVMYHGMGSYPKVVLGTGLVGAYTTFSTFSFETLALLQDGDPAGAVSNVALNLVVGGIAAAAGLTLAAI